jgi:hypothetical protein
MLPFLCPFFIMVVSFAIFMPVSMFIFMDVSFFMLVSTAGAGAIAGAAVAAAAVESVVVALPVSFVLHAATASNAATTTRRFIYDLLEVGAIFYDFRDRNRRGPRTPTVPGIGGGKAIGDQGEVKTG